MRRDKMLNCGRRKMLYCFYKEIISDEDECGLVRFENEGKVFNAKLLEMLK